MAPSDPTSRAHAAAARARGAGHAPVRVTETDAALIGRSVADPESFARIFDRHWPAIHRFCTARAGAAGEDVAAETFRVAFDRRGRYEAVHADAGPWLHGIALNLLRRHFRSAGRAARALARTDVAPAPDHADDALGRVEAEALGPRLAAALGAIPEADRDALLLHAWAGLTYEEVARATGVPVGTVRSRIHRARQRLRAHIPTGEDPR